MRAAIGEKRAAIFLQFCAFVQLRYAYFFLRLLDRFLLPGSKGSSQKDLQDLPMQFR
jgi:hypothetical protein